MITTEEEVEGMRRALSLRPVYKMVDTCAAEFSSETPLLLLHLSGGK